LTKIRVLSPAFGLAQRHPERLLIPGAQIAFPTLDLVAPLVEQSPYVGFPLLHVAQLAEHQVVQDSSSTRSLSSFFRAKESGILSAVSGFGDLWFAKRWARRAQTTRRCRD
jgi:hypothetical protein